MIHGFFIQFCRTVGAQKYIIDSLFLLAEKRFPGVRVEQFFQHIGNRII